MQIVERPHFVVAKARQLTFSQFFFFSLPIISGLGLGYLISMGNWHYALVLAMLAPFVMLFSARPFIGIIIWLVLIPISSALPNPDIAYWAIHRILIPFTLGMTILSRLSKVGDHSPKKLGSPELALGVLAILIPISCYLFPTDLRLALIKYLDRMLIPFCMYLTVRLTDLHERDFRLLQWTALFIAISQSVIGFLSWIAPGILPRAWHHLIGSRTAGSLLDPAVFTSLLVFCIALLFQGAMSRRPGLIRSIFLLACGLCAVNIFLSLERGSWLGGVFVFLCLLIFYPRPVIKLTVIATLVIGFLGASLFSKQISMASQRMNEQRTVDHRIVIIDAMGQMILEKWVFGWGYDNLNLNIARYYRQVGSASTPPKFFQTSHNTFLTIFTELGLVGFFLYVYPAYWCFSQTIKVWRRLPIEGCPSRSLLLAFWLAALQNIIVSNFMDMRFFPTGMALLWLTLGFIANMVDPNMLVVTTPVSSHHRIFGFNPDGQA